MKALPNILTLLRLLLSAVMFASLIAIGAGEHGADVPVETRIVLVWIAVPSFIVASVTDFLDGWLARRFGAVSVMGAILDPIADKILVCGAIVGLLSIGTPNLYLFATMGGVILFREFAVSALREVLAPQGIKLPVTPLAKSKTVLQLVALGAVMILDFWRVWRIDADIVTLEKAWTVVEMMLSIATAVTLWTGLQYARAAAAALRTKTPLPTT